MKKRFLSFSASVLFVALAMMASVQAADRSGSNGQLAAATPGIATRIVGGTGSRPGDWPSVLSVVNTFSIPSAFTRHYCGATLIDPYWALTAAHCLFEGTGKNPLRADQLRIVGGVVDLEQTQPEDEIIVTNVFIHPGYDNDNVSSPDDIGLIELAEPLDLPVMSLYGGNKASLVDLRAHIVGWGAMSSSSEAPGFSPEQQAATVPIVSEDQCNSPASYDGLVGERQLCAGFAEGGVDACAGDSGGPLIVGIDGYQVQAGVVSFGSGCAEAGFYGIYTHVAQFADWVKSYVQADFRSFTPPLPAAETDGGITGGDAGEPDDDNTSEASSGGATVWPVLGLLMMTFLRRRRRWQDQVSKV